MIYRKYNVRHSVKTVLISGLQMICNATEEVTAVFNDSEIMCPVINLFFCRSCQQLSENLWPAVFTYSSTSSHLDGKR